MNRKVNFTLALGDFHFLFFPLSNGFPPGLLGMSRHCPGIPPSLAIAKTGVAVKEIADRLGSDVHTIKGWVS
jgi:hypothetical protein